MSKSIRSDETYYEEHLKKIKRSEKDRRKLRKRREGLEK